MRQLPLRMLAVVFFLVLSPQALCAANGYKNSAFKASATQLDYESIISNVNMTGIREHVQFFSSLETRAVGYLGNKLAMEYIMDKFTNYIEMTDIRLEPLEVISCIDHGAHVTLGSGETVDVYALLPNMVSPSTTPPEGIGGRLIYVEDGDIDDYDGQEVEGSIVLMNWYGRDNWITAASLGAKAVIFIPPETVYASTHFMRNNWGWHLPVTPFLFPRFYVPNVTVLLDHLNEDVTLKARSEWETATSWNVIGFIEGEDPRAILALTAYYDSGGIVPSYAPGAREACGISALIELAKYFSVNKPECTIMFVALSGHWNGFAGSVQLVNDYISRWEPEYKDIGDRMWFLYNLDLSTQSDGIYFNCPAGGYGGDGFYPIADYAPDMWQPTKNKFPLYFKGVLEDINTKKPFGRTYHAVTITNYLTYIAEAAEASSYSAFMYETDLIHEQNHGHEYHQNDMEPFTFATSTHSRPYYGYPFNTYDKISEKDFGRLQKQLELIYMCLDSFASHDTLYYTFVKNNYMVKWPPEPQRMGPNDWGYAVRGNIVRWNSSSGWYDPIPNALVWLNYEYSPFYMYAFSDNDGLFSFDGRPIGPHKSYAIEAYVLNSTTGEIIYAPDRGKRMFSLGAGTITTKKFTEAGYIALFEAGTLVLLNQVDPGTMISEVEPSVLTVYDANTYITPEKHGVLGGVRLRGELIVAGKEPAFPVSVVATEPNKPIIITTSRGGLTRFPWLVLTNSTEGETVGCGYTVKPQQQVIITHGVLRNAEDFNRIDVETLGKLSDISLQEEKTEWFMLHEEVDELLDEARAALNRLEYSKYYLYASRAWSLTNMVYNYSRPKIEDSLYVVPFFALLLVPFVFLFERLVFNSSEMKRAALLVVVFAVTLGVLSIFHPGFTASASPMMVVIGISTLILVTPLLGVLFGRAASFVEALRVRILGPHAAAISRGSEIVNAFSIGVLNLRKRRISTLILMTAIVTMVSALVCFSSVNIVSVHSLRPTEKGYPLYDGIYIHKQRWGEGSFWIGASGQSLLDYANASFGDRAVAICPRAWKYTVWQDDRLPSIGIRVTLENETILVRALLGLTPQENDLSNIDVFVTGRWFEEEDRMVTILSEEQAEDLGSDVGDVVTTPMGDLTVIGIISDDYLALYELDGEPITPLKMDIPSNPYDTHLLPEKTLIMKFDEVTNVGGYTVSVSIRFEEGSPVAQEAKLLREKLYTLPFWFCAGEQVYLYLTGFQVSFGGIETQIVPLALVGLSMFNMLYGSVHERRREIFTYSTVGLSPFQVSSIFMAETLVYAVLGAVMGYLSGLTVAFLLTMFAPGAIAVNYGSTWVLSTVAIAIGCISISSSYPIFLASRMVTPSLERAWRLTTVPKGDIWEIPLPFYIDRDEEAEALSAFIHEYIDAHVGEALLTDFSVRSLVLERMEMDGAPALRLKIEVRLPPYDLGVEQEALINMAKIEARWETSIILERISGSMDDWTDINRSFIGMIRKQLLLWRSIPISDRIGYADKFREVVGERRE